MLVTMEVILKMFIGNRKSTLEEGLADGVISAWI